MDNSTNDAAAQMALSCVQDFREQAFRYLNKRVEEAAINRSASLLSSTIQPQHFNPSHFEISKFLIDMRAVMEALPSDSDALWACVTVLQKCTQNLEARNSMIEEYRYIVLLAVILKRLQDPDKMHKLLTLLQSLTYGIRITWEESYVVLLVEQLVQIIYNVTENGEMNAQLALSVLINLCYKNFIVLFHFLRTVNISNFGKQIQNYGVLASKMLIIMSDDIHAPDQKEIHAFIRSAFNSVEECLRDWNVPHLRHIVDFLVQSKSYNHLHWGMLSYSSYHEDVERLLNVLNSCSIKDCSSNDDLIRAQHTCLCLVFQLIRYVIELSALPETDVISVDSNVLRIFEFVCNWFESDICGSEAVNLLETLIRLTKKDEIVARISRDPTITMQLIVVSEKRQTVASQTTAILRLMLTLLHQPKTEKLILSKITESYFDKIFSPLLNYDLGTPIHQISMAEIEKSICCLLLLINFASIAKKAYFEKCCSILQMQRIHQALARATLSEDEAICGAVFEISRFEKFPKLQVAQFISLLNSSLRDVRNSPDGDQWRNLNTILKSHRTFVGKEMEERLNAVIEIIKTAHQNNQLNNLTTSQIIEMFNYKMEIISSTESSLQRRLEDASCEIANLTRRIKYQNSEMQNYQAMNFQLHISQEGLQTQCKDLKQQKDHLKRSLTDLMKKLSEQSESLQVNEKRLAVKTSELTVLQQNFNELKDQYQSKVNDMEKLSIVVKENSSRIDMLKKTIAAYELDVKTKTRIIDDKEREMAKIQKSLEEQKEGKKKSDGVIAVLEAQLQEKNEKIRNYELELNETEELRKTIMSLMESKKPKRKV